MRSKRRNELKKRLEKLSEEAQKLNRCLVLRRRAGYIYVGEAIKDMNIEYDSIGDFLKYFPIHQKYAGKKPITLLDLVNVLGGFNKAVLKMLGFMRTFSTISTASELEYVESLYELIDLCWASAGRRSKPKKRRNSTLFCCLCWRATIKNSSMYCKLHHEDKMLRQHDERRLYSAVREMSEEKSNELEMALHHKGAQSNIRFSKYFWTGMFANSTSLMEITGKYESSDFDDSWRNHAKLILKILSAIYPAWCSYIKKICPDDSKTWKSWLNKIRTRLDPEYSANDSDPEWLNFEDNQHDWELLLTVVHRFESYHKLHTKSRKRGPRPGSVKKNDALRIAIKNITQDQLNHSGKIKGVDIAKSLSISTQRVSVLLKELGLR